MNMKLLAGVIVGLVIIIALGGIGFLKLFEPPAPPHADMLERQVEDLKRRNAELKSRNEKHVVELRDLHAQVEGLTVAQPGGMAIEEKRKALAVREAELDGREGRLAQTEEQLRLDREKLENEERKFYNDRGLKVEEIGQAKEIKENQKRMLASLAQAEERATQAEELANNWLIAFFSVLVLFVIAVIALVVFLRKMASRDRRVDMAMRTVESVTLSTHDRNLLVASLGGRIVEQPRENDGED